MAKQRKTTRCELSIMCSICVLCKGSLMSAAEISHYLCFNMVSNITADAQGTENLSTEI